jgi:hypothetical protein
MVWIKRHTSDLSKGDLAICAGVEEGQFNPPVEWSKSGVWWLPCGHILHHALYLSTCAQDCKGVNR